MIGCRSVENVDQWPHLGHIISTNLNDQADILYRRNCFIGEVNNVLCIFGQLDSFMNSLFKVYCSSFYGCELWDLDNKQLNDLCIAWWWCNGKAFGLAISRSQVQIPLEATLRNNLGRVVHTYVPLSPSSITWYRPKGGDALRLGR